MSQSQWSSPGLLAGNHWFRRYTHRCLVKGPLRARPLLQRRHCCRCYQRYLWLRHRPSVYPRRYPTRFSRPSHRRDLPHYQEGRLSCGVRVRCLSNSRMLSWTCSVSNNQLCVTQTLSNIQTASGTLTIDKLLQIVSGIFTGQASPVNGTNLCTPCVKQIYNVAKNDFPAIFGQGTTITSDAQNTCGASFVGESTVPPPRISGWPPCSLKTGPGLTESLRWGF